MSGTEFKKPLLKQVFPELSDELIHQLVKIAVVKTYEKDEILCHEDHHEHTFYVIHSGEVEFTKLMGKEPHLLRKGNAGEFFGEMALLDDRIGRSATVRTLKPTTVLEIERSDLTQIVQESPMLVLQMARIIVHRMRENDRQALIELYAQKREVEQAYQALRKYEQQRTEFLYTMSHEIRTPLTSVMGYMQLIRAGHMEGAGLQMSLGKIGENLDRLVSLINDLFFLQEVDVVEPHFQDVKLTELVLELKEKLAEKAQKQGVNLVFEVADNIPNVTAELDGLLRAFTHLLDNAIKFSPNGGDVIFRAKATGDKLRVEVQDHGVGIAPEFMSRLFDTFERDETYEQHLFDGTGLGLPIVKRIIELHTGTIDVTSERGKGATFIVELPIDARRATQEIQELSIDDAWVDMPD